MSQYSKACYDRTIDLVSSLFAYQKRITAGQYIYNHKGECE